MIVIFCSFFGRIEEQFADRNDQNSIAKQKLGITFNSDKLGGIDFTKISKLTMCSA